MAAAAGTATPSQRCRKARDTLVEGTVWSLAHPPPWVCPSPPGCCFHGSAIRFLAALAARYGIHAFARLACWKEEGRGPDTGLAASPACPPGTSQVRATRRHMSNPFEMSTAEYNRFGIFLTIFVMRRLEVRTRAEQSHHRTLAPAEPLADRFQASSSPCMRNGRSRTGVFSWRLTPGSRVRLRRHALAKA